jgi:hypothetical protein
MPLNTVRAGRTLNLGPLFTPTVAVKGSLRLGNRVSAHTVRGLLMLFAATGASFFAVEDANGNGVLCIFHGSSYCRATVAECGPLNTGYEENSLSCPGPPPQQPPADPLTKLPNSAQTDYLNCNGPANNGRDLPDLLVDHTVSCRQHYNHDTPSGSVPLTISIPADAQVIRTFCFVRPGGYNSFRGCLDGKNCGVGYAKFDEHLDKTDRSTGTRYLQMTFKNWHPTDNRDAFYDVFYTVPGKPRTTDCKANPPSGAVEQ